MKIKTGVKSAGLAPETWKAIVIVDRIYEGVTGHGLVITSGTDGKHMPGSKHYKGEAFDGRSRDLSPGQVREIIAETKRQLPQWQVIAEGNHIHFEHDPAGRAAEDAQLRKKCIAV
jgi:hypothetical protein